jgi:hypothetical protein
MRFRLLTTPIICTAFCLHAQASPPASALRLQFIPVLEGKAIEIKEDAPGQPAESLRITMLRFYISGVVLCQGSQEVWKEETSYHLMDAANPESLQLNLSPPEGLQYNRIRFNLGVDSATSSTGAHGGDLDPAKGMYWAWHSGYINFKLEGTSPLSTARKHAFHFHLGGYQAPYSALQPVSLPVYPARQILVKMDLTSFLTGLDLSRQNSIMIPGEEAVSLSQKAATIFQLQ